MNRKLLRDLLLVASGVGLCLLVLLVSQRRGAAPQDALEVSRASESPARTSTAPDPGWPRSPGRQEALKSESKAERPLAVAPEAESLEDAPQV